MAATSILALLFLAFSPFAQAARGLEAGRAAVGANPLRKVVTMLQAMQRKVTEEGEKERELYDKFVCHCKNGKGELDASIAGAEGKVSNLGSEIKASEEKKVQLDEDLKQAQVDRSAAKDAMAEATGIREKEAAAFAAEKSELDANIGAIAGAVAALERGMAGGFLQTDAASLLRKLAGTQGESLSEDDRQTLLAFLEGSQGSGYVPGSGSITGILKQLGDEMKQSLVDATAAEDAGVKSFEELVAAKKKEVAALSEAIESKMRRSGDLAVSVAQMKAGLSDTEESLIADKEFLADMDKDCDTKKSEWEEIVKTRAEELVAIAETIKILNDDDSLELFKRTLPSAAASFVQLRAGAFAVRARAIASLKQAFAAAGPDRARLDLLLLALRGQKVGFEKVMKMIDGLVDTLKAEQTDDDHKKEYCGTQLDMTDDKKKELERSVSDKEAAIASAEEGLAALKEEIASLEAGIKSLDKSVAEATEQRKEEHEEFTSLMASNTAAKELLGLARNRLYKFYNPKLHNPGPKSEPAEAPVFAQITTHSHRSAGARAAPPPPPETFGAYAKKSQESTGVVAMIDLLIKDLDKQMTESETEERDAQADYEGTMKSAAEKRAADSKLLTEKGAQKASLLQDAAAYKDAKESAAKELMGTLRYLQSLHTECDWLLKYHDVRKEARASEIDALGKAKAVLSGADYSLLQTRAHGFLERSA